MGARAAIRTSICLTACRSFLAGIIAAGLIKIPNPYAVGAVTLAIDVVVSLGLYYFAEVKENEVIIEINQTEANLAALACIMFFRGID